MKRCVFAQLEQLQAELTADRESLRSAESLSTDLLKEKAQLEKTLETLQQNCDRQVRCTHTKHWSEYKGVMLLRHTQTCCSNINPCKTQNNAPNNTEQPLKLIT